MRFFTNEDGSYNFDCYRASISQIRSALKLTAAQINYRIKLGLSNKANHKPQQQISASLEAEITSLTTLTNQSSLSIKRRAFDFSSTHGVVLQPKELRMVYRKAGVKYKKLLTRCRPSRQLTQAILQRNNDMFITFGTTIEWYQKLGAEIIMLDESTFSQYSFNRFAWAPKSQNIAADAYWRKEAPQSVCAAISQQRGLIFYQLQTLYFNSHTFLNFLTGLKSKLPNDNYLIIMDNSSIHRTPKVMKYLQQNDIHVVWNKPNSPQYNGIEVFWAQAKRFFRQTVTQIRLGLQPSDQLKPLVIQALTSVPDSTVRACCTRALRLITSDLVAQKDALAIHQEQ